MFIALCPSCPENKASILWKSKALEVGIVTRLDKNEIYRNFYKNKVARLGHRSFASSSLVSPLTYFTWSDLLDLTLPPLTPPQRGSLLFALRSVDVFFPSRAWEILQRFLKCLLKYPSQFYIMSAMLNALVFQESSIDVLATVFHMCMFSESVLYETSDESFTELLKILFLLHTI